MASLRDAIAMELVRRLDALPGWTARMRDGEEETNVPILAIVSIDSESKRLVNQLFYSCTLSLTVMVRVCKEDADDTADAGNPVRYLDRMVALAESVVHGEPWPNEEAPTLTGHQVLQPENPNQLEADLTLTVVYRHNFADPTTYDPNYS